MHTKQHTAGTGMRGNEDVRRIYVQLWMDRALIATGLPTSTSNSNSPESSPHPPTMAPNRLSPNPIMSPNPPPPHGRWGQPATRTPPRHMTSHVSHTLMTREGQPASQAACQSVSQRGRGQPALPRGQWKGWWTDPFVLKGGEKEIGLSKKIVKIRYLRLLPLRKWLYAAAYEACSGRCTVVGDWAVGRPYRRSKTVCESHDSHHMTVCVRSGAILSQLCVTFWPNRDQDYSHLVCDDWSHAQSCDCVKGASINDANHSAIVIHKHRLRQWL